MELCGRDLEGDDARQVLACGRLSSQYHPGLGCVSEDTLHGSGGVQFCEYRSRVGEIKSNQIRHRRGCSDGNSHEVGKLGSRSRLLTNNQTILRCSRLVKNQDRIGGDARIEENLPSLIQFKADKTRHWIHDPGCSSRFNDRTIDYRLNCKRNRRLRLTISKPPPDGDACLETPGGKHEQRYPAQETLAPSVARSARHSDKI